MSGGGGGGTSSNTVTQTTQIPEFEQQYAQNNQALAQSLGSQPYPIYRGPLVQSFAPEQWYGMQLADNAASIYKPDLAQAESLTNGGVSAGQAVLQQTLNPSAVSVNNPANPGVIGSYMSPYVQQALQPQIQALQTQLGQQQNQINAQATQANAFGDARQGAAQALQNFYGNQALSGLVGQGYNTAYGNALQTAMGEQQLGLNEQQTQAQIGNMLGQLGLAGGQQMAGLANQQQAQNITGANAVFNVGLQQQQQGQQELNQAYQQYLNQVNWPFQMLNIQESALSNSPYNMVNATTVPQANMTAQGFGAGLGALGSIASLLGGGGGSGSTAPFGGTAFPSPH